MGRHETEWEGESSSRPEGRIGDASPQNKPAWVRDTIRVKKGETVPIPYLRPGSHETTGK